MYSNELVCKILNYIDENINNKITIDNISSNFNYNRFYIMKLFKRELNISIIDYINIVRINNSLEYIKNNYNFLSVALINGFYSLEYYSEIFKKVLGVNPSTYKKIVGRNNSLSDNIIDECITNLAYTKEVIDRCNKYKNNVKPSLLPVKKLSIFK